MTLRLRERTAEAARLYAETVQRNKELADINARLQAMQSQLIQSEKLAAVGQLTAGIVHDVKNPLAVIKGLAEVLQDDAAITDETRHELQVIRESAEKANRIVSDLLKFARQSHPEMEMHDLRETVEASIRLTTYLIREARIQLVHEIPEQMVLVTYDPQQVEQVLINMIHNAIQAMPNRGTLKVNLNQMDGSAMIAIQDTGIGISSENIKRIFDPFFTTKPEGVGTGLGLSVSYGIIANHQGRIEVESEEGKGTKFTIYLPMESKTT
jgi:two-component system NtrC family sensor kinase